MNGDNVQVLWMPKARKLECLVGQLLHRSYHQFLANQRQDVLSEYLGGNLIIVTTQTPEGQCTQIVFCREEIQDLPSEMQMLARRHLKIPAKRGCLITRLEKESGCGCGCGSATTLDDLGQTGFVRDGAHRHQAH